MAAGDLSPASRQTRSRLDERIMLYRVATKNTPKSSHSRPNNRATNNISALRLENYKHEQKLDQLEKERKQSMQRLDGARHIFKMSVRLPRDTGAEQYLDKYKGTFRANGEYRESEASLRNGDRMSRQSAKTRKVHHDQAAKSPAKTKPIACKTVGDLIAIMKGSLAPSDIVDTGAIDTLPPRPATPERTSHQGSPSPTCDRNEKLRLLLENYEVFVPQNDDCRDDTNAVEANTSQNEISRFLEQKWNGKSENSCSLDTSRVACYGASTSSFSRSKSAAQNTNKRISIPMGSKSETKVHAQQRRAKTASEHESFSPTVRQLVAIPNYYTTSEMVLQNRILNHEIREQDDFHWGKPSKRHDSQTDSEVRISPSVDNFLGVQKTGKPAEKGGKSYSVCSQECDILRSEPASRVSSCKPRVSFASIADMESSVMRENLVQFYNTNPSPNHDLKHSTNYHSIPYGEMSRNCSYKQSGDFHGRDEGKAIAIPGNTPPHFDHPSQDTCTERRSSRRARETRELPLKLFEPDFPMDYRKLFHLLYKRKSNKNMRTTSEFKPLSSSVDQGSRHNALDSKVTQSEEGGNVTHVKLKRTSMMVLGKGLTKDENPVKVQQAKETRQRMDQFFARLQSSINPINEHATRPNSPLPKSSPTENAPKKDPDHKEYKRAAPWPVEIYC